jgi:biotin carboxylase
MSPPRAVWFVGGGPLGLDVLRKARDLGLAPVVGDRNADAPGFALAEAHFQADGADPTAHLAQLPALAARFDFVGVWCGAEFGLETVRRLQVELGLPSNPGAAVARCLDKVEQKRALLAAGVPTPPSFDVRTAGDVRNLVAEHGRIVVKPAAGSGSRGVRVVGPEDDPGAAFAACAGAVADAPRVLAEPFVDGRSIDANGVLLADDYHAAGVLEKFTTPAPERLPIGGEDPAELAAELRDETQRLLERAARALGLVHGPVKGDLLLGADGLTLLEVAPRLHGDVTTCGTLPFGTGIDPVRFLLRAFTGDVDPAELAPRGGAHAVWRVICAPPGRVTRWVEPPEPIPGVALTWRNPRVAERIPRYDDTTRIPGYVTAHGATRADAEAALTAWHAAARIEVEPDPAHAEWYRGLARGLAEAGIDPAGCGYRG